MQKGLVGKENLNNHSCNVEIMVLKKKRTESLGKNCIQFGG